MLLKRRVLLRKPKTRSHLPLNITANDRARNYPESTFHVDDGQLFCSSCNVVVDHLRKFVVDKHLEAASHKGNAERKESSVSSLYNPQKCCYFVPFNFVLIGCMVCPGLTSEIAYGHTLINSLSSM